MKSRSLLVCLFAAACSSGGTVGTDGGNPGSDGGNPGTDGGTSPSSPLVSPTCIDGQYAESPLPTGSESIAAIPFDSNDLETFVLAALDARYPTGAYIVRGCIADNDAAQCINSWIFQPTIKKEVLLSLSTVVHEAGHLFDLSFGGFGHYEFTQSKNIACTMGDTTSRGGKTFARSELHDDAYQSHIRACTSLQDQNCDSYAFIYLDPARPNAGVGPQQGFSSVIEEATQYVNSLATGYAFRDQITGARSERDGILAFLWYVERYLKLARTSHTAAYDFIINDPCWREAILTLWGRAWLYLEHTEGEAKLRVEADDFLAEVMDPDLLAEIDRVRDAEGCP